MASSDPSLAASARSKLDGESLDRLTDCFAYLDDLRESGATNMFGAGQYLEIFMGCDQRDASTVLRQWMRTFARDKLPRDRAAEVLASEASPAATAGPAAGTDRTREEP